MARERRRVGERTQLGPAGDRSGTERV